MRNDRIILGIVIFLSIIIQTAIRESFLFLHFEVFIIFVIILSFLTDFNESLIWSFYCGLLQDIFAGGPALGIYTATALIISFIINMFRDYLMLKTQINLMLFVFFGTIAELTMTRFIYSLIFNVNFRLAASTTLYLIFPAVVNALIALPLFPLINRIRKIERRRLWKQV